MKRPHQTQNKGSVLLYVLVFIPFFLLLLALQKNSSDFLPVPTTQPASPVEETTPSISPPKHLPAQSAQMHASSTQSSSPNDAKQPRMPLSQSPSPSPIAKSSTKPLAIPALPPQTPSAPQPQLVSFNVINEKTRTALVNILCRPQNNTTPVHGTAGSGVIIDPKGVVLTNAHLASIYLVKNYPSENTIDCVLRTGSPARNTYKAELLYLSPHWIENNKNAIIEESPIGTGENDFALLRITEMTDPGAVLPSIFSFLPYEIEEASIAVGEPVLIAGYPASFLGSIAVQKDLSITSTVAPITKLYTFTEEGLLDLVSVGSSILAQKGSSGGAIVRGSGSLSGLVVTNSTGETTSERKLHAITLAHINRVLQKETGFDLQTFLARDPQITAGEFNTGVGKTLTNILVHVIEKK